MSLQEVKACSVVTRGRMISVFNCCRAYSRGASAQWQLSGGDFLYRDTSGDSRAGSMIMTFILFCMPALSEVHPYAQLYIQEGKYPGIEGNTFPLRRGYYA